MNLKLMFLVVSSDEVMLFLGNKTLGGFLKCVFNFLELSHFRLHFLIVHLLG
jgi:hypothetical protein